LLLCCCCCCCCRPLPSYTASPRPEPHAMLLLTSCTPLTLMFAHSSPCCCYCCCCCAAAALLLLLCCCCYCCLQSFASLYNIPSPWTPGNAAVDVTHASRTLLWLKSEETLVTYDRATTVHSGKFKRFNMNFIAAPTVRGSVVTAVGKVNKVQVSSLLPANVNISAQVRNTPGPGGGGGRGGCSWDMELTWAGLLLLCVLRRAVGVA
jgi:hypothetical protein